MDIEEDPILTRLNMIDKKLQRIISKLDLLEKKTDKCEKSCDNMDMHIDFVNDTYATLRSPLNYMQTQFNYLAGNDNGPLQQIKDKNF